MHGFRSGLLFAGAVTAFACGELVTIEEVPPAASDAGMTDAGATADADAAIASDAPTETPDVGADAPVSPCGTPACDRLVFTTSKTYTGDLGGASGADAKCNDLAKASPMLAGRTFVAWLSTNEAGADATSRHVHGTGKYVRVDGTLIATGWAGSGGFAEPVHAAPMTVDEKGGTLGDDPVWTGTSTTGAALAGESARCNEWTDGSVDAKGRYGSAVSLSSWTDTAASGSCDTKGRLYCIEK